MTSLPPQRATSQRLLRLNRHYWVIEHHVNTVRGVAFREDHSRIRKGLLPHRLAAFANLTISSLRLPRTTNIKRRMRQLHLELNAAVALILG